MNTTLQQAARRLITAAASAAVTFCLFSAVLTIAEPQQGQMQARMAQAPVLMAAAH